MDARYLVRQKERMQDPSASTQAYAEQLQGGCAEEPRLAKPEPYENPQITGTGTECAPRNFMNRSAHSSVTWFMPGGKLGEVVRVAAGALLTTMCFRRATACTGQIWCFRTCQPGGHEPPVPMTPMHSATGARARTSTSRSPTKATPASRDLLCEGRTKCRAGNSPERLAVDEDSSQFVPLAQGEPGGFAEDHERGRPRIGHHALRM